MRWVTEARVVTLTFVCALAETEQNKHKRVSVFGSENMGWLFPLSHLCIASDPAGLNRVQSQTRNISNHPPFAACTRRKLSF